MARKFTLNSRIKSIREDGDQLRIVGYASTADTDRVGDVIVPDAWTKGGLDNYQKNPIILFNHNYQQPVGRAVDLQVDSNGLRIECEISKSAGDVYGLIKDEVLSTFSVGFMIKDADYNQTTDGYIIRDAELLEVSVVSVPCNQAATFSVSKSLEGNADELAKFNKEVNALKGLEGDSAGIIVSEIPNTSKSGTDVPPEIKSMTPEEIAALVSKGVAEAIAKQEADRAAAEKIATEKAAADAAAETRATTAAQVATKSVEERLLADFDAKLKTNNEDIQKTFEEMKGALEEKTAELKAMSESKRMFSDRTSSEDPLVKFAQEAENAFMLSRVTRKKIEDTKFGKATLEKFNTHSSVSVGSENLERSVSTSIEKDIWNSLILAPLFREINMNSATMTFPIAPDAGYAEITTATTAAGSQPNGNLDQRGAGYGAPYQGITLNEKTLSTIKMISKTYLGNETEEDTIIPVLPLIKEAMARSHARGVENMFLAGNHAQGVYTSGAANGLIKFASTNSRTVTTAGVATPLTAAALFGMRKLMGKYGNDARDIVYIVSQQAHYELVEDPEFADADLIGSMASKLTGEVGRVYGSSIIMCDEFAPAATGTYFALALNRRNFIVPRLRGMTVESEYQVEEQRSVLVASQRLGFDEIISNAPSIVGLKYA